MEYHPYSPGPGGVCAVCTQPAMSPQHVAGYKPPGPEPAAVPFATIAAQEQSALAIHQEALARLTAAGAVVHQHTAADATVIMPAAEAVWVPPAEQTPSEQVEVQRMSANVELAFPVVGFIDPAVELEKMLRIIQVMPVAEKQAYPEKIRAAILAHEAGKGPEVSDEDLALAIFIQRTTYIPLTEEELEAKATGKKKREPGATPKVPKGKQSSVDAFKAMMAKPS